MRTQSPPPRGAMARGRRVRSPGPTQRSVQEGARTFARCCAIAEALLGGRCGALVLSYYPCGGGTTGGYRYY